MSVGEKIKRYREVCGMTQQKLSELSGVSLSGLKKYEAGERNPKPELLEKIADALQVYPSALYSVHAETEEEFFPFIARILTEGKAVFSWEENNGEIDADSITISFDCPKLNSYLKSVAESKAVVDNLRKEAERTKDSIAREFLLSRANKIEQENEWKFARKKKGE